MKARLLNPEDLPIIEGWIARDPEHAGKVQPEFFTQSDTRNPGNLTYAWEDESGQTLFYVKVENVARIHIQFNPDAPKTANAKGLELGYRWLIHGLKERGYREIIFESTFSPLIRFCKRVFGFRRREADYSKGL